MFRELIAPKAVIRDIGEGGQIAEGAMGGTVTLRPGGKASGPGGMDSKIRVSTFMELGGGYGIIQEKSYLAISTSQCFSDRPHVIPTFSARFPSGNREHSVLESSASAFIPNIQNGSTR